MCYRNVDQVRARDPNRRHVCDGDVRDHGRYCNHDRATQTPPNAKDEHDHATHMTSNHQTLHDVTRRHARAPDGVGARRYASRRRRVATTRSPRLRHGAVTAQRPLNTPRCAAIPPSPPFDPSIHPSTTTHEQKNNTHSHSNLQSHDRRPRARHETPPPTTRTRASERASERRAACAGGETKKSIVRTSPCASARVISRRRRRRRRRNRVRRTHACARVRERAS